jgi:hypothetical protein
MIADLRVPLRQVAETGIAVVPGAAAAPAGLRPPLLGGVPHDMTASLSFPLGDNPDICPI